VRGGNVKRVASAVGEGSIVISFVIKYSESKTDIDSLPTEQVRWIQQVTTAVTTSSSKGKVTGPNGAAAKLGIPPSALHLKIKQLNITKNTIR
jgi:hypothetical protein